MARYTQEFKDEAVALYLNGGAGLVRTASEIGIAVETLRKWVKQAKESQAGLDINERERLRRAEKENARLKEENEVLKKQPRSSQWRPQRQSVSIRFYRWGTRQPHGLTDVSGTASHKRRILRLEEARTFDTRTQG
jgi:transposase